MEQAAPAAPELADNDSPEVGFGAFQNAFGSAPAKEDLQFQLADNPSYTAAATRERMQRSRDVLTGVAAQRGLSERLQQLSRLLDKLRGLDTVLTPGTLEAKLTAIDRNVRLTAEEQKFLRQAFADNGGKAVNLGVLLAKEHLSVHRAGVQSADAVSQVSQAADEQLNALLITRLNALGFTVTEASLLEMEQQHGVSALGVTDILNKTVQVARDGARLDTLPEEAAHVWL